MAENTSENTQSAPTLHFGERSRRSVWRSMRHGWRRKCPACGTGAALFKYLKVNPHCRDCGEALHHHQADDAPPYFTIFIVGHIVIPIAGWVERDYQPEMWMQMILWPALAILLSLWFLPRVKGALIGLQWANYMHGFGNAEDLIEEEDLRPARSAD